MLNMDNVCKKWALNCVLDHGSAKSFNEAVNAAEIFAGYIANAPILRNGKTNIEETLLRKWALRHALDAKISGSPETYVAKAKELEAFVLSPVADDDDVKAPVQP